jgi:hypothetical protein
MIEKYIIGKEDLPKLIRGEELPLSQGSKARAFKIEIIKNLTNGDIIKNLFPNCKQKEHIHNGYFEIYFDGDFGNASYMRISNDWWNAPYEGGKEE